MRIILAIAAAALVASPVIAADTSATGSTSSVVVPKPGATLRDAKGLRLGPIDSVNADGSVQIIFDSKIVTIPANKLVAGTNGIATSLTRVEVYKLIP
jgi:hypothetical protein